MDGTVYSVNIYDASYSGSIIDLKGGAQPFTTQEDDTDDVFTPVRTQSGYIRIVDDGLDANGNAFDWRDLIPASATNRPVRLVSGSTVLWAGFIQSQTFTGHYVNNIQEREFPVCCLLTALSAFDIPPTNNNYPIANFAYILSYAFSDINSYFSNLTFKFQGGDDVDGWLGKCLLWSNFADKDDDGHLTSKYSCREVVEEVCKFFGWTVRTVGMTVFFEQTGSGMKWRNFGFIGLQNLGIGLSYTAVTENQAGYSYFPGSYISTKQNLMILRGWRKSMVTARIDKISSVLDYPTSEIYKIIVPEWRGGVARDGSYWYQYYINNVPIQGLNQFNCEDVVVDFQQGTAQIYGSTVAYQGFPFIWSEYHDASEPTPHDVSMMQGVCLEHAASANPDASHYLMRIRTKNPYWLEDGIIVISGATYVQGGVVEPNQPPVIYNGNGYLYCSLKVGGKYANVWYDGNNVRHTAWQNNFVAFAVNTGSDDREEHDGQGKIISTREWTDPYPSYDGFGMPIDDSIGGEVEFCIHQFYDSNPPASSHANDRAVQLMNLKLEFLRKTDRSVGNASDNGENKYTANGNTAFTDEKSVELAFATDNNNSFGRSIVCNSDGTYCQSISVAGSNVRPEQRLVNRMKSWGEQTRDEVVLETDGTNNARSLDPQCFASVGGKTYAPISIGHEWRDDKVTVKWVEA